MFAPAEAAWASASSRRSANLRTRASASAPRRRSPPRAPPRRTASAGVVPDRVLAVARSRRRGSRRTASSCRSRGRFVSRAEGAARVFAHEARAERSSRRSRASRRGGGGGAEERRVVRRPAFVRPVRGVEGPVADPGGRYGGRRRGRAPTRRSSAKRAVRVGRLRQPRAGPARALAKRDFERVFPADSVASKRFVPARRRALDRVEARRRRDDASGGGGDRQRVRRSRLARRGVSGVHGATLVRRLFEALPVRRSGDENARERTPANAVPVGLGLGSTTPAENQPPRRLISKPRRASWRRFERAARALGARVGAHDREAGGREADALAARAFGDANVTDVADAEKSAAGGAAAAATLEVCARKRRRRRCPRARGRRARGL